MKLLANENFPYPSIHYLKEQGYDVLSIDMDYSGIKDAEIMDIAIKEERIILTFDRDYGELIFRLNYKPEKGVIYLRLNEYTPVAPGHIVERLLKSTVDFSRALTVVDEQVIRQRKY